MAFTKDAPAPSFIKNSFLVVALGDGFHTAILCLAHAQEGRILLEWCLCIVDLMNFLVFFARYLFKSLVGGHTEV